MNLLPEYRVMLPTLDLELIRSFLTVVSQGELKSAAQKLHKTPSAISMQLKKLEELVGHRLLERSNQGIALTEAGRTLKRHGEQLIQANNDLLAELRREELSGIFTFGAPADYAHTFLHKLLPVLRIEYPKIEPRITLEPSRVLRNKVKTGELDVAIVAREPASDEGVLLWREELAWFQPERISAQQALTDIDQKEPLQVAILSTDCVLRDAAFSSLAAAGQKYQTVLEASSVEALKDAVDSGFCAALLPVSMAGNWKEGRPVTLRHVDDLPTLEFAVICAAGPDNDRMSGLQNRLAKAL